MNLSDQVISLELSKKLKELGVRQESLFIHLEQPWIVQGDLILVTRVFIRINDFTTFIDDSMKTFSAFTVGELGDMLPSTINIQGDRLYLSMDCEKHPYYSPMNLATELYAENVNDDDTEANARAKMLIYLIENKMMEVPI